MRCLGQALDQLVVSAAHKEFVCVYVCGCVSDCLSVYPVLQNPPASESKRTCCFSFSVSLEASDKK